MFTEFQREFTLTKDDLSRVRCPATVADIPELVDFLEQFGGTSADGGKYRIVRCDQLDEWRGRITDAFPDYQGRVHPFGFDWLGRIFALDLFRFEDGKPGVVMFEPGSGDALEIPANILSFHEDELIDFQDAALAVEFYKQWLAAGGRKPSYTQCIGYTKPLFLGGEDTVSNLELSDIDVYWTLSAELVRNTRKLLPGTPVRVSTESSVNS